MEVQMFAADYSADLLDGTASSWWFELGVSHTELEDLEYDAMLDSERAAWYSPIDPEANAHSDRYAAWLSGYAWLAHKSDPTANDDPTEFVAVVRIAAEKAFAAELRKCALDTRLARKAKLNARRSQLAAQHGVEQPSFEGQFEYQRLDGSMRRATTGTQYDLGDVWYEDAAKATGEEQDRAPDAAEWWLASDARLVDAAVEDRRDPIEALQARVYATWKAEDRKRDKELRDWDAKEMWALAYSTACCRFEDQDVVPRLTQEQLGRDRDDLAYMHRDDAAPAKGYGLTTKEERRKWLMDARTRYLDMVTQAMRKHRMSQSDVETKFPALKSESQFAHSVVAKWRFVDELERHESKYHGPDSETCRILKGVMSGTIERPGGSYFVAHSMLVARRREAERGRLDRYVTQ